MRKEIILLGATLFAVGPDAVFDTGTRRVEPVIRSGPDTFVLRAPNMRPQYIVPIPESGAGSSIYIDPQPGVE